LLAGRSLQPSDPIQHEHYIPKAEGLIFSTVKLNPLIATTSLWRRHRRSAVFLFLLWSFLASCGSAQNSESKFPVRIDKDVAMTTRDGVHLLADIYRPDTADRYPVLLQRDPYGKSIPFSGTWESASPERLASHGYVVVIQDTRGRYASAGNFYPFRNESADGYDAVEWAATLPNSNGKVALYGSSYLGATTWLAAAARPPHLKAIFPMVTNSNYYEGWVYRGGAFELLFTSFWTFDALTPPTQHKNWRPLIDTLPMGDIAHAATGDPSVAAYFNDWLKHENNDSYWLRWSIEEQYSRIDLPADHIGGWYDIFLEGTLKNYSEMRKLHPNTQQYLTIGPWTHYGPTTEKHGELDFGPASGLDSDGELLAWADLTLKGASNALSHRAKVKIFVMGRNEWRDENEWPLRRAKLTNFYLHSDGKANSSSGAGSLGVEAPKQESPDNFKYDPANPVPTHGGPLCCTGEFPSGPYDQSKNEARPDVLVYSTPALDKPVEVTGPISAVLYVSSDAPDTDFTAKLLDVYPDGSAINLTEGILRMRHRASLRNTAPPLRRGQVYRIEVNMVATSNLFLKGHRIRLEISSSNYPRFDRNLNSGEPLTTGHSPRIAENHVLHNTAHPSALILPIVPAD
jgi:putative CocE/NonD family hydrolase